MARLFALLTLVLIASMTQAERVDFSSMIAAAGTECYLENIGETINGKLLSSLILAIFHFFKAGKIYFSSADYFPAAWVFQSGIIFRTIIIK